LLQSVSEEPALELDAVLGGAFSGLEFVQGGFGAVGEGFVVDDRSVEGRDEFEEIGLTFDEVGPPPAISSTVGSKAARLRPSSTSKSLRSGPRAVVVRSRLRSGPHLCAAEQGFELPAEEVVILREGADYGWPQCFNDGGQSQKLMLAPEYGGDEGKKVGLRCRGKSRQRSLNTAADDRRHHMRPMSPVAMPPSG
jgi:hypothetical protein